MNDYYFIWKLKKYFIVGEGKHQGSALSAYLFSAAIDKVTKEVQE